MENNLSVMGNNADLNIDLGAAGYIKKIRDGMGDNQLISIEDGYFIFTLMPSLGCTLSCPHCYISLDQRRDKSTLSIENLEIACKKVDDYYAMNKIKNKVIIFFWYGGEPTEMGIDYLNKSVKLINDIYTKEKGYSITHSIITSLLNIDTDIWFDFFRKHCDNHFSTSFDGVMRGKNYVKKWEKKVRLAVDQGLRVGTISALNNELIKLGATNVMDYLSDLKVRESGFLPFTWNQYNDGKFYDKYAPTMNAWSDFMIEATEYYFNAKAAGRYVPEIGQVNYVLTRRKEPLLTNVAAQTLYLMPNGDFALPDYQKGFQEYMRSFGNIIDEDFASILKGKERKSFLRKQVMRDNAVECNSCEHANKCVMEFWKQNRKDDDCSGGKRYIEWLLDYVKKNNIIYDNEVILY